MVTATSRSSMRYPQRTLDRAERAVRCAPFRLSLYQTMVITSVDLADISGRSGVDHGYVRKAMTELLVEAELLWLIQVGLLRREVDGQGLTNSFRITPLGRQLVDKWHNLGKVELSATFRDRLYNAVSRWLRLPF
ncbi:Npun_F0494 family protein [Alkalinema pantanalense CENA528]|uniref:Npun_F0494 family protein n=1 Tax=Alkalinema pantanalense TaxID=1620705 RepID=UPI003D6FE978